MPGQNELWKAAGRRLADARAQVGFPTQREFAAAIQLSLPTIAKYEQGAREIPIAVLSWLSERGVSADFIVSGKGSPLVIEAKSSPASRTGKLSVKPSTVMVKRPVNDGAQTDSSLGSGEHGGSARAFDIMLLERLSDAVEVELRRLGQAASRRTVTAEAGRLYNELLSMASDLAAKDVVEALLPVVRQRFRDRLLANPPGTAKASD